MRTPGAGVLEIRIEEKAYAAQPILRDVRLAGGAGEVLVLLGPSGIGKSTVLNIALGLDRAFTGEARLEAERVGVVFQEPRLLPWLTVAENLRLVRPGLSLREIEAVCEEALLSDVAGLFPAQLSLGMARRVALARALVVEPQALVLDEPFASLDRSLADRLAAHLAARARGRKILLLVSIHDLDQALAMADRILVLAGSPATLAGDFSLTPDAAGLRGVLLQRFPFLGASAV